jgi:hypothetical protein
MTNPNLLNKILNRSLRDMGDSVLKKEADSVEIEYNFNSYGYRCNEFENQEILVLGCSQTEGHALPIHLTWPYLLSQKMDKDYANLAKGGDGAQAQVIKAFQFFKEFYHPKYIFAVFSLPRLETPLINLKAGLSSDINGMGKGILADHKLLKYSKGPHDIENVIPPEFAIFYNILFIKILIQYCEINNIKFIWTAYDYSGIDRLNLVQFSDGYFESKSFLDQIDLTHLTCHSEFANEKFFNYAADYDYWPPGHWGLHRQLHIAESMYNML